jgi:hypothetical protein
MYLERCQCRLVPNSSYWYRQLQLLVYDLELIPSLASGTVRVFTEVSVANYSLDELAKHSFDLAMAHLFAK